MRLLKNTFYIYWLIYKKIYESSERTGAFSCNDVYEKQTQSRYYRRNRYGRTKTYHTSL